ncbi:MAG: dihydrofolate reductase, partial [Deltaproteobacteria bacterium]
AIAACSGAPELFIIGGAEVYRQALPLAMRLQLTEIDRAFAGDVHFPPVDPGRWQETMIRSSASIWFRGNFFASIIALCTSAIARCCSTSTSAVPWGRVATGALL